MIWVSWMHSTWNADYISHASGQVGMATAPGMKGRKLQKEKETQGWASKSRSILSNSCLAPELQMLGRCQHAQEKQQLKAENKNKQFRNFSSHPDAGEIVWSLIPISLMVFGKTPQVFHGIQKPMFRNETHVSGVRAELEWTCFI